MTYILAEQQSQIVRLRRYIFSDLRLTRKTYEI